MYASASESWAVRHNLRRPSEISSSCLAHFEYWEQQLGALNKSKKGLSDPFTLILSFTNSRRSNTNKTTQRTRVRDLGSLVRIQVQIIWGWLLASAERIRLILSNLILPRFGSQSTVARNRDINLAARPSSITQSDTRCVLPHLG